MEDSTVFQFFNFINEDKTKSVLSKDDDKSSLDVIEYKSPKDLKKSIEQKVPINLIEESVYAPKNKLIENSKSRRS